RGRGGEGRARLRHRRGQLEGGEFGDDVAPLTRSPLRTLMAASWPPTSGAMRISVVRTTPSTSGVDSGRAFPLTPGPDRDHDEAVCDNPSKPSASHAPASASSETRTSPRAQNRWPPSTTALPNREPPPTGSRPAG